jgi:hypothetical protein
MVWANAPEQIPAPPQVALYNLTRLFPGALPSAILQEDYRTMQEMLTVHNGINQVREFKRQLKNAR